MEKILNLLEKKYNDEKCIHIVVLGFLSFYTLIFVHTRTCFNLTHRLYFKYINTALWLLPVDQHFLNNGHIFQIMANKNEIFLNYCV